MRSLASASQESIACTSIYKNYIWYLSLHLFGRLMFSKFVPCFIFENQITEMALNMNMDKNAVGI